MDRLSATAPSPTQWSPRLPRRCPHKVSQILSNMSIHTHPQSSLAWYPCASKPRVFLTSCQVQCALERWYTPRTLSFVRLLQRKKELINDIPSSPSPSSSSSRINRLSGCGPCGTVSRFVTERDIKSSSVP